MVATGLGWVVADIEGDYVGATNLSGVAGAGVDLPRFRNVFPKLVLCLLVIARAAASVDFRSSIDNDPSGFTAFPLSEIKPCREPFTRHLFLHSLMSFWVTKYDRPIRSQVNSPLRIAARIMEIVTPPSGKCLFAAISSGIGAYVSLVIFVNRNIKVDEAF